MSVKVTLDNDLPLSRIAVFCNVTKGITFNAPKIDTQGIISAGASYIENKSQEIINGNWDSLNNTLSGVINDAIKQISLLKLTSGVLDIDLLASFLKRNNIELDSNLTLEYSDKTGIANFRIRFISGIPGKYSIIFQSGSLVSKDSNVIELINPIKKVEFVNNISQVVIILFYNCKH